MWTNNARRVYKLNYKMTVLSCRDVDDIYHWTVCQMMSHREASAAC